MKIFSIKDNGKFEEFSQTPFQNEHEEKILENWIEANSDDILEDGKLLIIGRQVTTNLGSFIDLLGIDREGNTVTIELKRDRTPRETLAQALEYASFVSDLDVDNLEEILQNYMSDESLSIAEYHKNYFELAEDEAVSFNKEQRVVIIGQRITSEIRQTSSFLRKKGIKVTCLEFSFFQTQDGKNLLSYDIVVGRELTQLKQITSSSLPTVDKESFVNSLDENGRYVFFEILKLGEVNNLPIHWGTKGFSMNVDKDGVHVAVCYGYPPNSVFKQSIYTALVGRGGFLRKLDVNESDIKDLWDGAEKTGLFKSAGRDLKIIIDRKFTDNEIEIIKCWLIKVIETIKQHDLK
ncbi:MAG TPA: hypothetical protein ENN17_13190 [bacterium]|nr:hypothetical protein [bacterium]